MIGGKGMCTAFPRLKATLSIVLRSSEQVTEMAAKKDSRDGCF